MLAWAAAAAALAAPAGAPEPSAALGGARPVAISGPDGRPVETCADPVVVRNRTPGQPPWVMLCTSDPLHAADRHADGRLNFRRLPTFVSHDLKRWHWHGEALPERPPQAAEGAGLWAPELVQVGRRWHLYYAINDTADAFSPEPGCSSDSAIGVALADSPLGPWVVQPELVVAPRRSGPGCEFHWTIDPDLLPASGKVPPVLYFGSYGGGVFALPLDRQALRAAGPAQRLTPSHRYEGAEVVRHGGWHWLFLSSADCCRGPLTGYAVFAGRSRSALGPFHDRDGQPLADRRAGGTPFIVQDGGTWVGPGHNSVFADDAGRWWTMFHAISRHDGWLGEGTLSRRPALLGRVRWAADGWPELAGQATAPAPPAGPILWRDHFDDEAASRARWTRLPEAAAWREGTLVLPTQPGDLHEDRNDAQPPLAGLPADGDFVVRARVHLERAPEGSPRAAPQAGFVLHGDDDRYAKLVVLALGDMLGTEFAVEHARSPGGPAASAAPAAGRRPRFGSSFVGPPGQRWTLLELHVRRQPGAAARLRACTTADDAHARRVCGATWVHDGLAGPLSLGLVAMGEAGHRAWFSGLEVRAAAPR